jgi:hypothetical protein
MGENGSNGATTLTFRTAEQILALDDIAEETFPLPKWGTLVRIREFKRGQLRAIREKSKTKRQEGNRLVDVVDDDQFTMNVWREAIIEPRFTEEQYHRLKDKSQAAVDYVFQRIWRLNKMDPEAEAAAKATFSEGDGRPEAESDGSGDGVGVPAGAAPAHDGG